MRLFFLLSLLAILLAACNNGNQNSAAQEAPAVPPPAIIKKNAPDSVIDARKDTLKRLKFPDGDSTISVLGNAEIKGPQISIYVPIWNTKKLLAELTTFGPASNIRINQVIYPDGKMDGPYGKTLTLTTPKNGDYRLLIGRDLMAEGDSSKEFKLKVTVSR